MTTPRPKQTLKHISTRRNMSSESTNIMKKAQEQKRYQQKKCQIQNNGRTLMHTEPTANFEMIPRCEKVYNLVS